MITASELWPPASIVITAGDLTLTPVSDADLPGLAELILDGVHAPDFMPFVTPWSIAPAADIPRNTAQFHWGLRSAFRPESFHLDFAVRVGGELMGAQGFGAQDYPVVRTPETGSWLARRYHGRGVGTRMRQAVCAFLFDHLDAVRITSGAWTENAPSLGVSRKVGYRENGRGWRMRSGAVAEEVKLLLDPVDLVRGEPVTVTGHEPLRGFLGLDAAS